MGYSIYAICDSSDLFEKMKSFAKENVRDFNDVVGCETSSRYSMVFDSDIAYKNHSQGIGFNYSGLLGMEREYIFRVCSLFAILSDHVETFGTETKPAIFYDGDSLEIDFDIDDIFYLSAKKKKFLSFDYICSEPNFISKLKEGARYVGLVDIGPMEKEWKAINTEIRRLKSLCNL